MWLYCHQFAQFAIVLIAHILLYLVCHILVCHISFRFIGMPFKLQLIISTNKRTCHINSTAVVLFALTESALHKTIISPDSFHCLIVCLVI
jgi:hypothetical protein